MTASTMVQIDVFLITDIDMKQYEKIGIHCLKKIYQNNEMMK